MTELEYNFIQNPRFVSGSSLWSPYDSEDPPFTVVSSVPWGALPAGATAAACFPLRDYGEGQYGAVYYKSSPANLQEFVLPVDPFTVGGVHVPLRFSFGAPMTVGATKVGATGMYILHKDDVPHSLFSFGGEGPLGQWNTLSDAGFLYPSSDYDSISIVVAVWVGNDGFTELFPGSVAYATLFRLGAYAYTNPNKLVDGDMPYRDGDSKSWVWLGASHASVSAGPPEVLEEDANFGCMSGPWSAPGRILVAWGSVTPTFVGVERIFTTYKVFRSSSGGGYELIGFSRADCWYDTDVVNDVPYTYQIVGVTSDLQEEVVYTSPPVVAPTFAKTDIPPSPPVYYSIASVAGGRNHTWQSQPDYYRRTLLGYFIEDGANEEQPYAFIRDNYDFGTGRAVEPVTSWMEPAPEGERYFRMRAVDRDLNISEPSDTVRGLAGGLGGVIGDWAQFRSTYVGEGADIGDRFNGSYVENPSPWSYPWPQSHVGRQDIGTNFTAGDDVMVREYAEVGDMVTLSDWAVVAAHEVVPDGTVA